VRHRELLAAISDLEPIEVEGAATRLGETLALFPTNLPIEQWPTVIARDVWHGLPADPRRLRAIDETG
jgi:hypothetical protein